MTNSSYFVQIDDEFPIDSYFLSNDCHQFTCLSNGSFTAQLNDKCNIDCIVYEWSEWSNCSSCSLGKSEYRNRTREVYSSSSNLSSCNFSTSETEICNIPSCGCVNGYNCSCSLSEWTDWSSCSKSCGLGSKSRKRSYITRGLTCDDSLFESQDCNIICCSGIYKKLNYLIY